MHFPMRHCTKLLPCLVSPSCIQIYAANLAAIRQMRDSEPFKRVLRAVLAAGNFLNYGSRLGGALGFRLKALSKLADTKSSDAKTSLLQVGRRVIGASAG